jgi:hypothetical protein
LRGTAASCASGACGSAAKQTAVTLAEGEAAILEGEAAVAATVEVAEAALVEKKATVAEAKPETVAKKTTVKSEVKTEAVVAEKKVVKAEA